MLVSFLLATITSNLVLNLFLLLDLLANCWQSRVTEVVVNVAVSSLLLASFGPVILLFFLLAFIFLTQPDKQEIEGKRRRKRGASRSS